MRAYRILGQVYAGTVRNEEASHLHSIHRFAEYDLEIDSGSHKGWLCEVDGAVTGFAVGNRNTGEIWVIAVLLEFEGRGIGKRLLHLVENWLWSCGWKEIWLTTFTDEHWRAVGFYRKQGWEDWKIERDRYMRKRINATADGNADIATHHHHTEYWR